MALRLMKQTSEKEKSVINNHIFHNATRFAVSVNDFLHYIGYLNCTKKQHIRLDLMLILAYARLTNYHNC